MLTQILQQVYLKIALMVNLDKNWLIGDSDSVFYRHTAIPRLFIMRTAPSSLSKIVIPYPSQ
ncbi:MAG: hypothetical protein LBR89_00245 [Holosporales bacterium]|nr:hypothetical protein [Holosporales bacterium]